MSYYFRDKPRFSDKLRGKTGDELFQELKHHLNDDTFEQSSGSTRDPFERHSTFPRGFPFDDQGFGRLGDIRSQLDNLATRHPEFAEHLLGPPWGDTPLHGTLRNRRRGSGSGNSHRNNFDEDTRSQASGSSAASAASGASGVSSHGESDSSYHHQEESNKIPQYGLHNTVDIGQHNHNMDNAEKINREQRSASAPPENRQQTNEEVKQQEPAKRNQRFISRVDITPQFNQQSEENEPMLKQQQKLHEQSTAPPQQQKVPQQQANVRHIPIFVEGRDEPIIPKNMDGPTIISGQQSPSNYYSTQFDDTSTKFTNPTHFQRPMTFNQHFAHRPRDWSPHFQDSFHDVFDHPSVRKASHPTQSAPLRQSRQQQHYQPQSHPFHEKRPSQHEYNYNNLQTGEFQSQSAIPTQQPEATTTTAAATAVQEPKQKQFMPKNPLEKIDLVQKEVDSLTEQIKLWNGNSKADKQYIYLDEMLTRELIKLDDIETEGKDNVRQARKNTIKSIQNSIALLESKILSAHPIDNSQLTEHQTIDENETKKVEVVPPFAASTEEDETLATHPLTQTVSPSEELIENSAAMHDQQLTVPINNEEMQLEESRSSEMEVLPMTENLMIQVAENQSGNVHPPQNVSDRISFETVATEDKEEDNASLKNNQSPKKLRKTKKPTPISEDPIPLPAADNHLDMK